MRRLALLLLFAWPVVASAARPPARIVSLNPCLDAILVNLAAPRRIVAISHYSRDPNASVIPRTARRFAVAGQTAEAILALKPDLVLASRHTDLATRQALTRLRMPMALFDTPRTVAESHAQIRAIARLTGDRAAGERLIARIDAALAAATTPGRPLAALIHHPSGLTPGLATLPDDLLRRTGYRNMATDYRLQGWGRIGLETIIARPPALLLMSNGEGSTSGQAWLGHRALQGLKRQVRTVPIPAKILYCGGPTIIVAARTLAAIRRGGTR